MAKTKSMTEGTPWKLILSFSVPIMLGQIFQLLYTLVDTKVVGAILGEMALASVGSVSTLYTLMTSFSNGLTLGFAVLLAVAIGAKNYEQVKRVYAATIELSMLTMAVITVIAMLFLQLLMNLINVPAENMQQAKTYVSVLILGLFITTLYNMFANSLRAIGDAVTPLIFLIIASLSNVVLDYLFVGGFHMGVAGAAYATLLAQLISVIFCFVRVKRRFEILHVSREHFRLSWGMVAEMYKSGISMGLTTCLVGFGTLSLQIAINTLGTAVIVAHTAARKVCEVMMTPGIVVGVSMATFSGQNYGARRMDRIKEGLKSTWIMSLITEVAIAGITWVCAGPLIRFLASTSNQEVIYWGRTYLRFDMSFILVCFMVIVLRNTMQGFGDRITPIVSSFIELVGKVVFAFVFVPVLGYWGIILSEPIVWIAMIIPLIIMTWKKVFSKKKTVSFYEKQDNK